MIGGSPAAISDTGWTTTSPSRSLRSVPRCAFVFASSGLGPRFIVEAYGRRHGQHPRREPEKKAGRREAQRPTNVLADADRQRDGFHKIGGASGRERVCQYVSISVGAVPLNKKTDYKDIART